MIKKIILTLVLIGIALALPINIFANPYFHIIGGTTAVTDSSKSLAVYLVTDGSTITAMQTVVNFNSSYLTKQTISVLGSKCSFWSPGDPSLGYGNSPAPYFYGTNKAVLACGFSNPGYTSSDTTGHKIATLTFNPEASGSTTLSFSNSQFRYIGTTITAGASPSFDLSIYQSTESANEANPTATPIPTPTTGSSSGNGSTTIGNTTVINDPSDSLSADDLNLQEVKSSGSSGTSQSSSSDNDLTLESVDEDDSIPSAPDLPPRAAATPFIFNTDTAETTNQEEDRGEVLSVSSLRELLIPGKSEADRTVVMVNFISTITFIVLLAIALWRMITISRMNKLKYQHMADMLSGELSAIQTKLSDQIDSEDEVKQSFNSLMENLEKKDKK